MLAQSLCEHARACSLAQTYIYIYILSTSTLFEPLRRFLHCACAELEFIYILTSYVVLSFRYRSQGFSCKSHMFSFAWSATKQSESVQGRPHGPYVCHSCSRFEDSCDSVDIVVKTCLIDTGNNQCEAMETLRRPITRYLHEIPSSLPPTPPKWIVLIRQN